MRYNQRIFIFLFTFYIVVAIGSLFILNGSGSVFDRQRDSLGAKASVLNETTIIANTSSENENTEEIVTDVADISQSNEEVENEELKLEDTPLPEETEPETTDESSQSSSVEIRYFSFVVQTESAPLRVRNEPSENGKIIKKIYSGSHGHILKPGNKWCKVITSTGIEGYCSKEYLVLTEIEKEEFPENYVDRVEASDESLEY